jgi:hypothetical protein
VLTRRIVIASNDADCKFRFIMSLHSTKTADACSVDYGGQLYVTLTNVNEAK